MKIKICGLRSLDDISYVNEAKVDFAGFIFAPGSKRYVTKEQAKLMKQALNSEIKSAGVFVDEKISVIKDITSQNIIDLIQLHGNETNAYIKELRLEVKLPIIKAFRADENLEQNIKNTIADYVLIDSINGKQFGGTGKTFDYRLIPQANKPVFLAGGLNIHNIETALKQTPYCVDINSGVETDGKKDLQKIQEIVQYIHTFCLC